MQPTLLNATMPQKSTERYKLSLPQTTVSMLEACVHVLETRRKVKHTYSDVLVVAMDSVIKTVPTQVKMLCRFYHVSREDVVKIKVRKEIKQEIYEHAKKYNTTAAGFIDSIVTIFFKAAIATMWKNSQHNYNEFYALYTSIQARNMEKSPLNVRSIKEPFVTRRKLTLKKDENEMRHHNYMQEFRSYMEKFGGIDKWLNQNVLIMIHARPLANTIGKSTDLDLPKEQNPGAVHMVRLWKRGRGYNITIIANHESAYGEEPPQLEPGSVYRLYDIYRNIDWLTIKTN